MKNVAATRTMDQYIHVRDQISDVVITPQPYINRDFVKFERELIDIQIHGFSGIRHRERLPPNFYNRLSMVSSILVNGDLIKPSSAVLEGNKVTKSWNVNYLSHGWHRYVGRFPPQIVRALLNTFRITSDDVVLDPFVGSGTSLVESTLLGIKSMGIEINPLSHLIARTKVRLYEDPERLARGMKKIIAECSPLLHSGSEKINPDNFGDGDYIIPDFPNKEKWFNKDVLDQLSAVLSSVEKLPDNIKDFFYLAISSGMRSMANIDVDVCRTEYRKTPRENVDVLRIVERKINRFISDIKIAKSLGLGKPLSKVLFGDVRKIKLEKESIDFIITSPPYGIESISYLRTHALSYWILNKVIGAKIKDLRTNMIGTDYVLNCSLDDDKLISKLARDFFSHFTRGTTRHRNRIFQCIQYFQDMEKAFENMSICLKNGGKCVIVMGNKKLFEKTIPSDRIFAEIARHYGLKLVKDVPVKLVCNNANAKTPWSERMIKEENILIFSK